MSRVVSSPVWPAVAGAAAAPAVKTVLVIVEEPMVRELWAAHLRAAGCFPLAVGSWSEGRRLASQVLPDAMVIDLDGSDAAEARWLEESGKPEGAGAVTVVLLSAHAERLGTAGPAALRVPKPYEPREVVGRLLALWRPPARSVPRHGGTQTLRAGPVELDRTRPQVRLRVASVWRSVDLPPTEHRLLRFLLSAPERVRSREEIRAAVWGASAVNERTVDQYVRRLRRTLDSAGAGGLVKTVTGAGYRLQIEALERRAN